MQYNIVENQIINFQPLQKSGLIQITVIILHFKITD